MLAIRCNECNREISRTTPLQVVTPVTVAESGAWLVVAMKNHQHNVHNDVEVDFGLDIVEEV